MNLSLDPKLILVVCNGNIHRSVVAQHCLKKVISKLGLTDKISVISRGLQGTCGTRPPRGKNIYDYPMELSYTKPILDDYGIDIPQSQRATPIDLRVIRQASVILAMDVAVLLKLSNCLVAQFPEYGYKMRLYRELEGKTEDIPDCGNSNDPELHCLVNSLIYKIANENIDKLISLIEIFS